MPSSCAYLHSPLPYNQFFNRHAFAKDSKNDIHCIPDLLSTISAERKYRWHWFWRQQRSLGRIWGFWCILIDKNWRDTLMYISKDIFICTIKEQCSDNENLHAEDKTTVKTLYLKISPKVHGCIMQIRLCHTGSHPSVNHFSSCSSGY
jgi:hypothetical protein